MSKSHGKEWLKLCDDFVSDEIVYIDKELINWSTRGRAIFVEGYISAYFDLIILCRITCRHSHFNDYR